MEPVKPKKQYVLKKAAAAAVAAVEAVAPKKQYTLKRLAASSEELEKPKKKVFSLRKKKPVETMTYAEEIEDAVRTYWMTRGYEEIPEDEKKFMVEMLAHDATEGLNDKVRCSWYDDAVPQVELTEEQAEEARQRAIDEANVPPHGTSEFWAWIRRRKARINKEREEKGLPPLPTKKEKDAAAAKKKAEKEAAAAAKVAAKAEKAAAKEAKAAAKANKSK
jgi:hypothetical protein